MPDIKDSNTIKFAWNLLDRVMFIAIGAVGTIATSYFTGIIKLNPPKLTAVASYTTIDPTTPVTKSVGGLKLDYEADAQKPYGIFRVDIANSGRGAAENVRFQVKLDSGVGAKLYAEPDFKVYKPAGVSFENGEFYTELATLPQGAGDYVVFAILTGEDKLCSTRIKLVNNDYEGKVSKIDGVECE